MKKVHFVILLAFSLILITSTAFAIIVLQSQPTDKPSSLAAEKEAGIPVSSQKQEPEPQEPKFRCPLDGSATSEDRIPRRPLAVMIENHPDARPQSGLNDACIVYETVAEGGITRFMAIYVHSNTKTIGPVRSAREYFVDLTKQFNAIYSHCGGPVTVYTLIKNLGVTDMDEFTNSDAYWRIHSRKAPHNLYTSIGNLRSKAKERGYEKDVVFQKPNFKDDEPIESRPTNASIDISFSKPEFAVHYEYNRKTNRYNRTMGGRPHIDSLDKKQIAPKNVVVQCAPISGIANDPKGRMRVSLIGTGQAYTFLDGKVIEGTWQRPTLTDLTRFYDSTGNEIKFNRGQTWIELIDPSKMRATYQ